jgi:DNA processing protein
MPINQINLSLLKLTAFPSFGPATIRRLEKFFPFLEEVFSARLETLKLAGLEETLAVNFIAWRNKYSFSILLQQLEQENISFISWHDIQYPKLLLEITSPPPILFYRGDISIINSSGPFLAIVGTRKNTVYAEKIISEIVPELIKYNFKIISGLALGVDSLAHKQTLTESGITIAVLGSGLSNARIYPFKHLALAQEIIKKGGLILSEFLPDCPALKNNFPRRNRIISGLAQAVLVIEAEKKSGSLITANHALDQNRDILAIPGNIFYKSSIGTNELIKKGARCITGVEDILENFQLEITNNNQQAKLFTKQGYAPKNEVEREIYNLIALAELKGEKLSTDEIIQKTKLDTSTINSTLSILEIVGSIKNQDNHFILRF